jgi:hypothetical protein
MMQDVLVVFMNKQKNVALIQIASKESSYGLNRNVINAHYKKVRTIYARNLTEVKRVNIVDIKIETIKNLLISKGLLTEDEFEKEFLKLRKEAWNKRHEEGYY